MVCSETQLVRTQQQVNMQSHCQHSHSQLVQQCDGTRLHTGVTLKGINDVSVTDLHLMWIQQVVLTIISISYTTGLMGVIS